MRTILWGLMFCWVWLLAANALAAYTNSTGQTLPDKPPAPPPAMVAPLPTDGSTSETPREMNINDCNLALNKLAFACGQIKVGAPDLPDPSETDGAAENLKRCAELNKSAAAKLAQQIAATKDAGYLCRLACDSVPNSDCSQCGQELVFAESYRSIATSNAKMCENSAAMLTNPPANASDLAFNSQKNVLGVEPVASAGSGQLPGSESLWEGENPIGQDPGNFETSTSGTRFYQGKDGMFYTDPSHPQVDPKAGTESYALSRPIDFDTLDFESGFNPDGADGLIYLPKSAGSGGKKMPDKSGLTGGKSDALDKVSESAATTVQENPVPIATNDREPTTPQGTTGGQQPTASQPSQPTTPQPSPGKALASAMGGGSGGGAGPQGQQLTFGQGISNNSDRPRLPSYGERQGSPASSTTTSSKSSGSDLAMQAAESDLSQGSGQDKSNTDQRPGRLPPARNSPAPLSDGAGLSGSGGSRGRKTVDSQTNQPQEPGKPDYEKYTKDGGFMATAINSVAGAFGFRKQQNNYPDPAEKIGKAGKNRDQKILVIDDHGKQILVDSWRAREFAGRGMASLGGGVTPKEVSPFRSVCLSYRHFQKQTGIRGDDRVSCPTDN